ncbi:MAG TPA: gliding motility protein GldL [Bacteroidales bacterium]|nr:gliding motility protein GldL [Bacteroidales bacterium]HPF02162.1 gliding motility protein GldL [Bacteroidales bacterium]HPJ59225.1 gliding motility protein GldL [Bacteroidales bacterium]HPR11848.1 gliding motility protein GldL [Bacteroidales bacterium]HRW84003.1 gliding motility protein GldL [Bacteroidales bacterium]
MSLAELVQSSGWKNFIAKLYGIGASVVILGALFKIQHWPLATFMLTLGLCTEAVIFFFSAFEPLHEEVDWSLVYPELAGIPDEGEELPSSGRYRGAVGGGGGGGGVGSVALAKFDEMLEKAEITPDLFQKLGAGMTKLSESTANINVMGDISAASAKYMNSINNATDSLGKLAESYQKTTSIINETGSSYKNMAESLSVIEAGGKSYQQQLEVLNKNLSALNAVYELQKKGADDHLRETETIYKELQGMVKGLADSAGDTTKYREQIAKLNDNLSALNNVYGNMLAAMNVR